MSSRPDISVLIPVCAWPDPNNMDGEPHPQLPAALASILQGLAGHPDVSVELLVGVDGQAHKVAELVRQWAAQNPSISTRVEHFEKSDVNTWGNRQRNGMLDRGPRGRLIVWQDQDDRFFPEALGMVARTARDAPGCPLVFKMWLCHWDPPMTLWQTKGRVEHAQIGGHMLVVPNEPALIGRWLPETEYAADFNFIRATLDNFSAAGREAYWSEGSISMLRPHAMGI